SLPLMLPVLMHQPAKVGEVASLERTFAAQTELFHVIQIVNHRRVAASDAAILISQDLRSRPRITGKEHQQIIFQGVPNFFVEPEGDSFDGAIPVKSETHHSAECRDILILSPNWLLQQVDFDVTSLFSEFA